MKFRYSLVPQWYGHAEMLELTEPWDRLAPAILVGVGALFALGSILLARVSRYRVDEVTDPDDPLGEFHPRSIEEIEAERPRRWPAAGVLLGVALVASGLLTVPPAGSSEPAVEAAVPTASPYLVDVQVASVPSPSPTPTPTPTSAPTPTPHTHPSGSSSSPGSGASGGSSPSSGGSTAPTEAPRPPGPIVEANASCFGDSATLNYQVTARNGTVLRTLRVILDGQTVHEPGVDGSSRHNGQYQQVNMSPGSHRFTLRTTASDGGRTHRHYPVTC